MQPRAEIFDLIEGAARERLELERGFVERRFLLGDEEVTLPDIMGREIKYTAPSWYQPLKRWKLIRARKQYAKDPW